MQGHWQAARNTGMHQYIRMQLAAAAESQFSLAAFRSKADISNAPLSQSTHAAAPAAEYLPAQHRHASVHTHQPLRLAVLHQLPSAARRHAGILQLFRGAHFHSLLVTHTLVGQESWTRLV